MDCLCDLCGAEFELELREDTVDGIAVRWFRCDQCGAVFIPYAEDRDLAKARRRYWSRSQKLLKALTEKRITAADYEEKLKALRAEREDIRERAVGLTELVKDAIEALAAAGPDA